MLRAAVLLRGGMPAVRVWRAVGEEAPRSSELRRIAHRIDDGQGVAQALAAADDPRWRVLAAAWNVAELSGAPLAPTLERFAGALRALEALAERRGVLLAGPRSTVRLVVALPPLALVLGTLLGFDPVPVLLSPFGAVLTVMGTGMLLAGTAWARSQIARVAAADRAGGWALELTCIGLGGGGPPGEAMRNVADCVDRAGAEWVRLSELRRDGPVRSVLSTAAVLGAAAVPLLLGAAEAERIQAQGELERAAERLGVRVLVPLGVCVLPAFVLLGVVPVLMAVLGGVVG